MGGGGNDIPETADEKAQAEVAMKRWNDYQTLFRPYEDQFFQDVDQMNSAEELNLAENLATTPLAAEFARQGRQVRDSMYAQGINPNSGSALRANNGEASQHMKAKVDAGSRATSSQQDRYVRGIQNIVAMGQGQAGEVMQGFTDLAADAQENAVNSHMNATQGRRNWQAGTGIVLGGGLRWAEKNYYPAPKQPKPGGLA